MIDIRTIIVILGITHLMQVLVFFHQYKVNKIYKGIGWWLMWSGAEVIGFFSILLRDIPSVLPVAIILQNTAIVSGTIFIYIGVMRFFDKKENLKIIIPISAVFEIGLLFFLFVQNNIQIRSVIINLTLTTFSFLTVASLFKNRIYSIRAAANFNAVIFIIHGCIFLYRSIMIISGATVSDIFAATFFNIVPYFDALIVSLLWTFGFIIMVNQRLNAEMTSAKEHFELIFNTSPDAAVITRMSDGKILDINSGFISMTDFTKNDAVGKSIFDLHIWKNPDDRQRVIDILKKNEFCNNFEAIFHKKNGDEINGLMSAKVFNIQSIPHIISITRDITEMKKAVRELQESEDKFRGLFDNSVLGIYRTTTDGKILECNQSILDMLGYDSFEDLAKRNLEHYGFEKGYSRKEFHIKMHSDGEVRGLESAWKKKDGTLIYLRENAKVIKDENGNVLYYEGTVEDITDSKKMQEELLNLSLRNEAILDSIPDIIMEVNIDKVYTWANKAGLEFFGKDVIGKEAVYYFEGEQDTYENVEGLFKGDENIFYVESWQRRKDGEKRLLAWWCRVLKDKAGKVIGALSSAQDITVRKYAEEALRESEQKFRETVTYLDEGYYSVTMDGVLLDHNRSFNRLLGFDITTDLKGSHLLDFWQNSDERSTYLQVLTVKGFISNYQINAKKKTGQKITVLASSHLVLDKDNHPLRIDGIILDITERKRDEEEIRRLNEKLEHRVIERTQELEKRSNELKDSEAALLNIVEDLNEKSNQLMLSTRLLEDANKELEAFSYSVSHDLRAPLRGIDGFSLALYEDYYKELDDKAKDYIKRIRTATSRMDGLIDSLLKLSRVSRFEMRVKPVNLSLIVKEISADLRSSDGARDAEFIIQDNITAMGDANLLKIVLENLFNNSWKFTSKKEKSIIEFGAIEEYSKIIYFIKDNGIGFDMKYSNKLFGAFQRLHSSKEYPGTGIGLTTVQRIIHRHNGTIRAESELNKGTTFYFTL